MEMKSLINYQINIKLYHYQEVSKHINTFQLLIVVKLQIFLD